MQTYEDAMSAHRIPMAQVLLTHAELDDSAGFLRARHALMALLDYGVVPVINENDAVAVEEILDTDNDLLAARVPRLVEGDLLVNLTTSEGIYATSPRRGGGVIPLVTDIKRLVDQVSKRSSRSSQRSLAAKVHAAELTGAQGVPTLIASGVRTGVLSNILDDETLGTLIAPPRVRRSRKKWIAEDMTPAGTLLVLPEMHASLVKGNQSLLPAAVQRSEGSFRQGDAVRVLSADGEEFGRGLVGYSIDELSQIQGKSPDEIENLLGYKHYEEVIRRDDLVIL
jgi:glutamate 5-kinase